MELIVRNIRKSFKGNFVLNGLNYDFVSGRIIGLVGDIHSGKTTLFNILSGSLPLDEGEIICYAQDGREEHLSSEDIAYIFTKNYLPKLFTGYEFLEFYCDLHSKRGHEQIDEYFDFLEISQSDRHRLIKTYTDDLKLKLSLIGLLISRPKVILLDDFLLEETPVSKTLLSRILSELSNDCIIILSTTCKDLANECCDEVVLLNEGKLVAV